MIHFRWKTKIFVAFTVVFACIYVFFGGDGRARKVTLSYDLNDLLDRRMRVKGEISFDDADNETTTNGDEEEPKTFDEFDTKPSKDKFMKSSLVTFSDSTTKKRSKTGNRRNVPVSSALPPKLSGIRGAAEQKKNDRLERSDNDETRFEMDKKPTTRPRVTSAPLSIPRSSISISSFFPTSIKSNVSDSAPNKIRKKKRRRRTTVSLVGERVTKSMFDVSPPTSPRSHTSGNVPAGNRTAKDGFSGRRRSPIVVDSSGKFLERVRAYNAAISRVREEIETARGYREWRDVKEPNELTVIWGSSDDFLERLAEREEVVTIVLPWLSSSSSRANWSGWSSLNDSSNVLVKKYYEWSGSEPLCSWIKTPGLTKAHWDAVYNRTCNTDVDATRAPRSLEWLYFHGKPINVNHYWPNGGVSYPDRFYTSPPASIFYLNVLQDAIINLSGDVISGGVKVVPFTCSHDYIPTIPIEYREVPVYREVFVMTQFWGTTYFHKMLEVVPRVAPYLDFLWSHPNVQIHAPEDRSQVSEFLRILGVNPERVVTGITRAKTVYLPQGTPCGFPLVHEIQLLSHEFRKYIREHLGRKASRKNLVLVRRSGYRRFRDHGPIEDILRKIAKSNDLNFTLFVDNPTPPLSTTMSIFNSAAIIVAPHGAGLANMIFSEPKTLIVEGVCNPPHVNMCFQFAAHSLGHRYHGIPSDGGCEGVVTVQPEVIERVVNEHLKIMRKIRIAPGL